MVRRLVFGSSTTPLKYPACCNARRTPSVSSSSLEESKVLENRFSRKIELGMPTGFMLCMDARSVLVLTCLLPWKTILQTLILGPSLNVKDTAAEAGGIYWT